MHALGRDRSFADALHDQRADVWSGPKEKVVHKGPGSPFGRDPLAYRTDVPSRSGVAAAATWRSTSRSIGVS